MPGLRGERNLGWKGLHNCRGGVPGGNGKEPLKSRPHAVVPYLLTPRPSALGALVGVCLPGVWGAGVFVPGTTGQWLTTC